MLKVSKEGASVFILPVVHGRLEFAQAIREKLLEIRPKAVAVEYPQAFTEPLKRALKRLPLLSVLSFEESDGTEVYLVVEPTEPLIEAARTAQELEIPVFFVDLDIEGYQEKVDRLPDPYLVYRLGYERYASEVLKHEFGSSEEDVAREVFMAEQLKKIARNHETVAFVCGFAHARSVAKFLKEERLPLAFTKRKKREVRLFHLSAEGSREVLSEPGFFQGVYEKARREGGLPLDRFRLQEMVLSEARAAYKEEFKEEIPPQALRVFRQFVRNYALLSGRLTPDLYQMVVAARGVGGDDFAWHLWEVATRYPYQTETPDLVPINLRLEDLAKPYKKIRFFRRQKPLHRKRLFPVKRRAFARERQKWKELWKGGYICSFPPEDIVIENFGKEVMKRAIKVLSEDLKKVEPFTVSLKDGPDIRETLRHWYEGRIYIVDAPVVAGKAGSVVVIFDEDLAGEERYPWKLTWHGEHDQESDMAFYATKPGEVVIGPGISRCVYGGFMLTYPPMRVYDIWEDPYFDFARTKPERLLVAAIDYSLEKYIVYVAKKPPSALARSFAARQGKKVIYLPIGSFSPLFLKKIRVFHVLEGHHVRAYAHKYINQD